MRKNARSKYRNSYGVTIVEMMVVAVAIGILCAMAIPNFVLIRNNAHKDQCITNLRRITAAKEHWSMESGAADTATPTAAQLDGYIKDGTKFLYCPLDPNKNPDTRFSTSYAINAMKDNPTCKIQSGTHKLQ